MEVSTILIASSIVLIGLQICVPETPNGKFEADLIERYWTQNPLLKIFYGQTNILGVIFVIGWLAYLVFNEHWWYIGVYLAGVLIAKAVAFIFKIILTPFYRITSEIYSEVVVQRIAGIIIIIVGMALVVIL